MLCNDPVGCNGGWGGREAQGGEDICIYVAESPHCTTETNTTF